MLATLRAQSLGDYTYSECNRKNNKLSLTYMCTMATVRYRVVIVPCNSLTSGRVVGLKLAKSERSTQSQPVSRTFSVLMSP